MAEPKTKPTAQDAREFLGAVEPAEKRRDAFAVFEMMERISGEQAVMWGTSIVGFGSRRVTSGRGRYEAVWPLIGFSPRKQNLTLYIMSGNQDNQALFDRLGKHKTSMACVYVKRLADLDLSVLETLIETSYQYMKQTLT